MIARSTIHFPSEKQTDPISLSPYSARRGMYSKPVASGHPSFGKSLFYLYQLALPAVQDIERRRDGANIRKRGSDFRKNKHCRALDVQQQKRNSICAHLSYFSCTHSAPQKSSRFWSRSGSPNHPASCTCVFPGAHSG